MPSLRCTLCATNWPNDRRLYKPCPECGGETSYMRNAHPVDAGEANSRRKHAAFERYCQKRDAQRVAELEAIPTRERPSDEPVFGD